MDFEQRLRKAIERGQRRGEERSRADREKALSVEELKRLHSQYRLQLAEHIEQCVKQLSQHFPGFDCETIYGERGWGAAGSRDDFRIQEGRRVNDYSRLELTVRPFTEYHVLDLAAKGTIRNKEVFNRSFFEKIADVDVARFVELVDLWVLEYAELYSARA
jgi:hypothetical protein